MSQIASIIIRTLNESRHLEELLDAIGSQQTHDLETEVVLVDSGSTDRTLDIARRRGCLITTIDKSEFTFGRSLNRGCEYANGNYLVFVSGHCIPTNQHWLTKLIAPLEARAANYAYGRQVGRDTTRLSEKMLFDKYYPSRSSIPQEGYFCNNANAAISRDLWHRYRFNEEITGLEDMYLAKQIVADGGRIAYVAEAPVYHIHDESWRQVLVRYEREALALRQIHPEMHFSFLDFLVCYCSGVLTDLTAAVRKRSFWSNLDEVLRFRLMQYWGAYRGNHEHRKLSRDMKMRYFYPNVVTSETKHEASRLAPDESKQ